MKKLLNLIKAIILFPFLTALLVGFAALLMGIAAVLTPLFLLMILASIIAGYAEKESVK
jgi:hypothetical protein